MKDKAFSAYQLMFKLRENANSMLFTRISMLVVVQAAVISFLSNTFDSFILNNPQILIIIEIFGLSASLFMVYLVRSSIFWVGYWDRELKELESFALGKFKIFRTHPYVNEDKRRSLGGGKSTRTAIFLFSCVFAIVWIALIVCTILILFREPL